MFRSVNAASNAREVSGDGGAGLRAGGERDLARIPDAAGREVIVHHQRRFAGRRRAFEWRPSDRDENMALRERRSISPSRVAPARV